MRELWRSEKALVARLARGGFDMRDSEPQRDRHHERELWRSEIALVD